MFRKSLPPVAVVLLLGSASCGPAGDAKPGVTSQTTATTTNAAAACENGTWPRLAQGQPRAVTEAVVPRGYFVWNDFLGWHVRVVDPLPQPQVFKGAVVASGPTISANVVPDGSAGIVAVTGNRLDFEIPGGAGPRGFDVAVGCASGLVRFELNAMDGPWPIDGIFLGGSGRAFANPLVIERQR